MPCTPVFFLTIIQVRMITFIYTNSFDTTADLLVNRLGCENVFRFNFNQWMDYKIRIGPATFRIENPAGRVVTETDVCKLLWRKPMRSRQLFPDATIPEEQQYHEEELWYAMRELVNFLHHQGKVVMVTPFGDVPGGKLVQAHVASRYFHVPEMKFLHKHPEQLRSGVTSVVKSLSSERVENGSVMYTTSVRESDLNPLEGWLIQDLVNADKDVTIAHVRGSVFAFELSRHEFQQRTVDWRELAAENLTNEWPRHELEPDFEQRVVEFMQDMGLHYGRLDFLWGPEGYSFLEVNSNGEWGWLDADGQHGLLDRILEEVSPHTPCHPIPSGRKIRW